MADGFKPCSVDGCNGNAHYSVGGRRGLCCWHTGQERKKRGRVLVPKTPRGAVQKYFREVVLPYDGDECLLWPYSRNDLGRAQMANGGSRPVLVQRLVCEARYGPPPSPKHEVAHSCGKGHLGCVAGKHLQWKTHAENMQDKKGHGTWGLKLKEEDVIVIRKLEGVVSTQDLADRYGVDVSHIHLIWKRETWKHV